MMTRRVAIGGGLAGIALASALSGTPGRAADGAPGDDFEGKFLLVELKTEPDHAMYIESARVKKLGERTFLVGTGVKFDHPLFKPFIGVTQWLPVDEIKWIGVYPSLEALVQGFSESPKQM